MRKEYPVYLRETDNGKVEATIIYGKTENNVYRELREIHTFDKKMSTGLTVLGLTRMVRDIVDRFNQDNPPVIVIGEIEEGQFIE